MKKEETKQFIKDHANNNTWFVCSDDQYPAVNELVKEGFFKPLTNLINTPAARHWFIPTNFKVEDLPKIFSYWAINQFGVFELNLDFQI